jgi:hypothetical protein
MKILIAIIAGICGYILATFLQYLGELRGIRKTHKQAVENNCGYYDAKTSEFKWGKP